MKRDTNSRRTLHSVSRRTVLIGAGGALSMPFLMRTAWADDPIKVGWVGPLSPPGGYAEGTNMKNASQIAVDEVNAQGGILKRNVELVFLDTRGQAADARTASQRLIQSEGVVAGFGEYHSAAALAEIEVFHKFGIPFVAGDVWSDQITAKGYPEIFRGAPTVSLIYTMTAEWIVQQGFKNVAIISEITDIGKDARNLVTGALDKAGIKYDAVEADVTLTDFNSQILRFKSSPTPYDLFLTIYTPAGITTLIRQAHDLGFAPTANCALYAAGGAAVDPTFWENVGDAGISVVTENVGLPKSGWNDKTKTFTEKYQAKFNAVPSGSVMTCYDCAWLIFDAIERAGDTKPEAIIKALESTAYVGTRGKYAFGTDKDPAWHYHQYLDAPMTIIEYTEKGQAPTDAPVVWPKRFATVDLTYKKPG